MTYSIVARDSATGQLGVAVQSHYFSVGSVVPWLEPGVGAVATQASVEIAYGPRGLDLLRAGKSAPDALATLVTEDADAFRRQVAMVDAYGRVAAHTGERCIPYASHLTGDSVSVQANMMERDTVPAAMLAAYQKSDGDLAERLLSALEAAEAEGGDIRGKQSAAIAIVEGTKEDIPGHGRVLDLRVEDSPEPLPELRRLITVWRAYKHLDVAETAGTAGDMATAIANTTRAMQLAPDNTEIAFWTALGAATSGQVPMAKSLLANCFAVEPRWRELIRRLPGTSILPITEDLVRELTAD
jgi:uncharacterized Ntn-hydrolase superfamily protein